MNDTHKGHKIIVSTSRLAATRWEPRLTIMWSEDGHGRLSKLTVNRAFRVRREAEMEGLTFAKKWIDDGKPDLSTQEQDGTLPMKCLSSEARRE
jgi:hypothetical protein